MTRDAMVFPFRWFDSLLELEADLPLMLVAIRQYAEKGEEPKFKGAMAAVWREYKSRIDRDNARYSETCERNRDNAKKRWQESDAVACDRMHSHANGCERMRKHAKNADVEGEVEGDIEKKPTIVGKEKAPADAVASATATEKESFVESSLKPTTDFSRWSEEQFKRSVSEAVEKHPEYKSAVDAFSRYWLEPDKRGRYRFALERTWSTAGRLATWYLREVKRGNIQQKTSGFYRDPKTGVVTGTADEESYAEWKRNGGF